MRPTMIDAARFSPRLGDVRPTAAQLDDEAKSSDRFASRLARLTRKADDQCATH